MVRQGRDLEKLVASVEKLLAGTDIEVKSPDYIVGVKSGSRREIDVSLRTHIGSAEILVILEVRDQGETNDVSWVDQLEGKRADVLASKVVAVSSSGFSEGAKTAAERLGIELRSVDALTKGDILEWFQADHVQVIERLGLLQSATMQLAVHLDEAVFNSLKARLAHTQMDAPILTHTGNGRHLSIRDAWLDVLNANGALFDDLHPDGPSRYVQLQVYYPNPDNRSQITTDCGSVHIAHIWFTGELSLRTSKAPISRIAEYAAVDGQKIARSVHFSFQAGGQPVDSYFHRLQDGTTALSVSAQRRAPPDPEVGASNAQ